MTEKIKTGLCVCALLLALLAAYVQEVNWPDRTAGQTAVQPASFAAAVQIN